MIKKVVLELELRMSDFLGEWKRCNLLANYLAAYTAYQFPKNRERAENLISTVVNELLEAVTRLAPQDSQLHLAIHQEAETLVLQLQHRVQEPYRRFYLGFLERLNDHADEAFFLDLLVTPDDPAPSFNQLGLAMLVHDFGSSLHSQLEPTSDLVHTRISLPTQELSA